MTNQRGRGPLGIALEQLAAQHGTLTALAKVLGCGVESLSRWIRREAKPAPKYAERICALAPELRTLLTEHGCFVAPNRRPRAPGQMGPGTSRRTQQRREAANKAARKRAEAALPWPSKATKKQRRPMLRLLIAARKQRAEDARERKADAAFTPSYAMEER